MKREGNSRVTLCHSNWWKCKTPHARQARCQRRAVASCCDRGQVSSLLHGSGLRLPRPTPQNLLRELSCQYHSGYYYPYQNDFMNCHHQHHRHHQDHAGSRSHDFWPAEKKFIIVVLAAALAVVRYPPPKLPWNPMSTPFLRLFLRVVFHGPFRVPAAGCLMWNFQHWGIPDIASKWAIYSEGIPDFWEPLNPNSCFPKGNHGKQLPFYVSHRPTRYRNNFLQGPLDFDPKDLSTKPHLSTQPPLATQSSQRASPLDPANASHYKSSLRVQALRALGFLFIRL